MNLSSDSEIVKIMVKTRIFNTLLQIILNVMKISKQLETKKEATILVESKMIKEKGKNQKNERKREIWKKM